MTLSASAPATLSVAATAMLDTLRRYLPAWVDGLPSPSVSMVRLTERAVGLGGIRSVDVNGPLGSVTRRGLRLDAVARFQVWASDVNSADQAISDLNMLILSDRTNLSAEGFLRLALDDTPLSRIDGPPDGPWRANADYHVLYEYDYEDTDGAESLIARIPVEIDGEFNESMNITDETARWDNLAAPALVVRGAMTITGLSLLVFTPKAAPAGKVTVTRTSDQAAGNPVSHATLGEFLNAISGANAEQNASVTFASFSNFLAAFQDAPGAIGVGDWDANGVIDQYRSLAVSLKPAVALPTVRDRFEVRYAGNKFNQVAVAYLRATQG